MKNNFIAYRLIFLIGFCQPFFSNGQDAVSNEIQDKAVQEVALSFTKEKTTLSSNESYFNILKLENTSSVTKTGKLRLTFPNNWTFLGENDVEISLQPNEKKLIPLRFGISRTTKGGVTFVIGASFKTKNAIFSNSCYLHTSVKHLWSFEAEKRTLFFKSYEDQSKIRLKLSNRGNTDEYVQLNFKVGQLLKIDGINSDSPVDYIRLDPGKDTIIEYNVTENISVNDIDKAEVLDVWKSKMVNITASSQSDTLYEAIRIRKLESVFENKFKRVHPLNFDIRLYNLGGKSQPSLYSRIYGTLLLKNEREISYDFIAPAVSFNGTNSNRFIQNSRARITYTQPGLRVEIGDVFSRSGLNIYGFGISGQWQFIPSTGIDLIAVKNRFINQYSVGGVFTSSIIPLKGLTFLAGGSFSTNADTKDQTIQALSGFRYSFLKYHQIGLTAIMNLTSFNDINLNATQVQDYGWSFNYGFRKNNLDIGLLSRTYIRPLAYHKGTFHQLQANYKLSLKNTFRFSVNGNTSHATKYGESLAQFNSNYENFNAKLIFSRSMSSSWILSFGPNLSYNKNSVLVSTSKTLFRPITVVKSLVLNSFHRFNRYQSVSAYLTYGFTSSSETEKLFSFKQGIQSSNIYSIGSSYRNRNFSFNVSYRYGAYHYLNYYPQLTNTIDQSVFNSISVRPQYEKRFDKNRMKFLAYLNYSIYNPSARENLNTYLRLDYYINELFNIYVSNNIYYNRRDDKELGSVAFKNVNFSFGAQKSFAIKQPRLSYYDLTMVLFHDINGNQVFDEGEPLLPNIRVNVQREKDSIATLARQELITSPQGEVVLKNIPEGYYDADFSSLHLLDLYNVNGNTQKVPVTADLTFYVPYGESYKLKGKVTLVRDEYSNKGTIKMQGIRVMAISPDNREFYTFTDAEGKYTLSVPEAGQYKVKSS